MPPSYVRFPHLHGDTLVFVAENDVWTAPVTGGRAYRLTADDVPVRTRGCRRTARAWRGRRGARGRRRSSSPTSTAAARAG